MTPDAFRALCARVWERQAPSSRWLIVPREERDNALERNYYMQYVTDIDNGDFALSDWEIGFIENLLTYTPFRLSEKQAATLKRMAEKYLGEVLP